MAQMVLPLAYIHAGYGSGIGLMIAHTIIRAIIYGLVFKTMSALGLKGSIFCGVLVICVIAFLLNRSGRRGYY